MGTSYKIHEFMPYPERGNGEPVKRSCVKCGRLKPHWLHAQWEKVNQYKEKHVTP